MLPDTPAFLRKGRIAYTKTRAIARLEDLVASHKRLELPGFPFLGIGCVASFAYLLPALS